MDTLDMTVDPTAAHARFPVCRWLGSRRSWTPSFVEPLNRQRRGAHGSSHGGASSQP